VLDIFQPFPLSPLRSNTLHCAFPGIKIYCVQPLQHGSRQTAGLPAVQHHAQPGILEPPFLAPPTPQTTPTKLEIGDILLLKVASRATAAPITARMCHWALVNFPAELPRW
jgi:hypothetical protein